MPISRSAFLGILLALVVLLSPQPPASDGSVVGFASAERRAEVGADGSVEEDDEYDDEDYEEDDEEEVTHEEVAPVNTRAVYEEWSNNEMTTAMWSLIDRGDLGELKKALEADTDLIYLRSEDGRGPLFWAYEYERYDMVKVLLDMGADAAAVDAKGNTPVGLMGKDERPAESAADAEDEEEEYEDDEEE